MKKLVLKDVTLFAVTSVRIRETVKAMKYSMRGITFGDVILFANKKPSTIPKGVKYEPIEPIDTIQKYNEFILYKVSDYIHTPYMICMQWDGYIVNPRSFRKEFYQYDYIGALWPEEVGFKDENGMIVRVGNGGASWRSKKLMDAVSKGTFGWETADNEDIFICASHRNAVLEKGFKIAPVDVAKYFSHERVVPEIAGIRPFMIHKWSGDNMRYPEFGAGIWKAIKKRIYIVLSWLKCDKLVKKLRSRKRRG